MEGLLAAIWATALVLCAAALTWMGGLILARLFRQRTDRRRKARQAAITSALVGILSGQPDAIERLRPYARRGRLIAEALLELLALVRGGDRERVVCALRDLGVVGTFVRRIGRGSRAGQMACMEALAAFGGEEAISALTRAVEHGPRDLRIAALKALKEAGDDLPVDRLLAYLDRRVVAPSDLFGDLVRKAVTQNPDEAVRALSRPELSPTARVMLLDALGAARDYAALPPLIQAAEAPEADVRAAAIRSLGRLMHPGAEDAISRALGDEVWFVRSTAAEAAGAAGFSRLEAKLAAQLSDEVWWVRFRAADALALLGQRGISRLQQLTQHGEPVAQLAASLALAERRVG